jgi:hypothetical protein
MGTRGEKGGAQDLRGKAWLHKRFTSALRNRRKEGAGAAIRLQA